MLLEALANADGTPREIVTLNAGAALYAAGVADVDRGRHRARARRDRERRGARASSTQFVALTQQLAREPTVAT